MASVEASDKRDIVRGAGVNFFGFIIRLSSRLPFILLVVALFGNELYGRYIFIITTVELGAALSVFGFKRSLFKFIIDKKYNGGHTVEEVIVSALLSSFAIGLLITGLIYISAEQLAAFFDYPQMVQGLRQLVPIILLISILDILLAGTRASRKMKFEMVARSFIEPYVLLFSMLIFYALGFGETGLLMAYGVAIFAAFLTAVYGCSRLYSLRNFFTARPKLAMTWKIARFSAPTAFHDLALLVFMRMDVFTVKFFFAEGVLGIYNVAQQIATSVEKIYQSFYPILAPVMSRNLVDKEYDVVERQMVMVGRWTLMVQCFLVIISVFYSGALMHMIVANGADEAVLAAGGTVLILLMIGETVNGGFGMADMPLLYRFPAFNPLISIVMVPFYILVATVFVTLFNFGIIGVAGALLVTYLLMNLVRVLLIRRLMGINMFRMSLFRVIFATVGSAALFKLATIFSPVELIYGAGAALGIPLIIVIYGLSLVLFCLTADDKARLMKKLRRSSPETPQ